MRRLIITHRPSMWLVGLSFTMACFMTHPTVASLLVTLLNGAVLLLLRLCAKIEGETTAATISARR